MMFKALIEELRGPFLFVKEAKIGISLYYIISVNRAADKTKVITHALSK